MNIRSWRGLDWLATILSVAAALLVIVTITTRFLNSRVTVVPPIQDMPRVETSLPAHVRGDGAAVVLITEFMDFECPFCNEYARHTYSQIDEAFVATGLVRYAFRHYPIAAHNFAADAARAAECAIGSDQFWSMRERLFFGRTGLHLGALMRHAETIPLSRSEFESCLHDPDTTRKIEADIAEARRLGVVATPTFVIGRLQRNANVVVLEKRVVGAQPFELFRAVLDEMIAGSPR